MRRKDAVGRYGEDVAVRHLGELGMEVLDRNWRCDIGEIDIVARDGGTVVVCEVKTRSSLDFGSGLEAVTREKKVRLHRLALRWLDVHRDLLGWSAPRLRVDVLAVHRQVRGRARVEHVRGAS